MRFVQQQTVAFTRGFVLIGTQKDFFQWSDGRARPSGIAVSLFLRFVSCVALAGGCNQPLRLSRQSSNESVVSWEQAGTMAPLAARRAFVMVGPAGPLATISREPGQARKGAAAAVTSCAGVWLAGPPPSSAAILPALFASRLTFAFRRCGLGAICPSLR